MVPFHGMSLRFRIVKVNLYSVTCDSTRHGNIKLILTALKKFCTDGLPASLCSSFGTLGTHRA
jgi:hypothetical protein